MKKFAPYHIVVAAALFAVAAESAWSQEATSGVPDAPAEQTAWPETAEVPAYAPAPGWHGYEPAWQPPPWPAPPPGFFDPYYPPPRPSWAAPAAPAASPLSTELEQTQGQLAAKNTELNTANEQLSALRIEQQATQEALQQAQEQLAAKTTALNAANEKVASLVAQQDKIYELLRQTREKLTAKNTELNTASERLTALQTEQQARREAFQRAEEELTAKDAGLDKAAKQLAALRTERQSNLKALQQARGQLAAKNTELIAARNQLATLQAEQQAIKEIMHQIQAATTKSGEQLNVVLEEMGIVSNVLTDLKARLDVQNTSLTGALQAGAVKSDTAGSAVAGETGPVTPPAASVRSPETGGEQTRVGGSEPAQPGAE